jgi:O-antigen/teichoic acid export membrane protein
MPNEMTDGTAPTTAGTARAVLTNTLSGTAGRLLGGLFAAATIAVTSRALGTDGYGAYATALAFFFLFAAVADGGFYQILVRDLGRPDAEQSTLLGAALFLRAVLLTLLLGVGVVVFLFIPRYEGMTQLAGIAAATYIPLSFGQLLMAVFQKHLMVHRAAAVEVIARAAQFLGAWLLLRYAVESPASFLWLLLGATVLHALLLALAARQLIGKRPALNRQAVAGMLREALPVGIAILFTITYFRLDTVMLSLLQSSDDVGIYNLAYKLLEQLIFFPAALMGILTPLLTNAFSTDKARFTALTGHAGRIITALAAPMLVGGWFLADPIVTLLGGGAFAAAASPLRVLLFATVLIFLGTLLGALVVITGRQRRALPVYIIAMLVNVALNLVFIPKYSYFGAAWSTVVTELLVDAGLFWILLRGNITLRFPKLFGISASALGMGIPLMLFAAPLSGAVGAWSVVVWLLLCPPLYLSLLVLSRVVSRAELRLLLRRPV